MKCPECGAWTLIKETKESPTYGYRRRRECANYHKFTTQEILVPQEVIKEKQRENSIKHINRGREKKLAFHKARRRIT